MDDGNGGEIEMDMNRRKNVNRGYRKLRVWQDAIELYVLVCEIFWKMPYELKRVKDQAFGSANSIHMNIAEGYCRRSLKEYLNFLNISLGSSGELGSCIFACFKANQLSLNDYEKLDIIHFKVENELLQLVKSLQEKDSESWNEHF